MRQVEGSNGGCGGGARDSAKVRQLATHGFPIRDPRSAIRDLLSAVVAFLATATPLAAQSSGVATIEVVNHISGLPVVGVNVTAKKRVGDSFTWVAQKPSDGAGRVTFQLAGLGTTATYTFFCNPYGTGSAQSRDVAKPGTYRLSRRHARPSRGGRRYACGFGERRGHRGTAGGFLPAFRRQAITDANGSWSLDPMGSARPPYVFEPAGPSDGTIERGNDIRDTSTLTFVVGDTPLDVTLADALTCSRSADRDHRARARRRRHLRVGDRARRRCERPRRVRPARPGSGRTYVLAATVYQACASPAAS